MLKLPKRLFIYGTGNFSHRIASVLEKLDIQIVNFLEFDLSRAGEGVCSPNQIEIKQDNVVVLGLGNPEANIRDISKNLKNLGFRVVLPVEIVQYFFLNGIHFENYWLTGDLEIYARDEALINQAKSLFEEKKSLKLFDSILEYRTKSDLPNLSMPEPLHSQYMPSDLPWIEKKLPVSIIDCGAFTGDSIETFVREGLTFENYFAFEPDSENYSLLLDAIKTKNFAGIFPIRLATWSKSCIIKFQKSGGNNSGAHISDAVSNNLDRVLAVKLDDMFASQRIDLIKMDIEGAEKETLLGLIDTIKANTPFLAISVYHKPEDLWEIPILIDKISNNYSYFLRTYGEQTFDTVLYCVPTLNN